MSPTPWTAKKTYYYGHGEQETYILVDANGIDLHSPGGDCGSLFSPEPYLGFGLKKEDADHILELINKEQQ